VRTTWRLLLAAAFFAGGGASYAAGYLDAAMKSPASFDEALGWDRVELASMLEPDLAEPGVDTVESALQSAATGANSCCNDLADCCGCPPTWTVRAGAVILERSRPRRTLVVDDTTGGTERGWADRFDFGFEGGPDLTITRWLANGNGVEVRYFGALQWDDQHRWNSAAGWSLPALPPIIGAGIGAVDVNYLSRLNSTEINYREAPNQTISYLVGFRWIELHEELGVAANLGGNQATVGWNTDNHLYGGQLGAEVNLFDRGGPLTFLSWFKGGLYGNDADNNFALTQTIGPDLSFTDQTGRLAFVGDIAFTGSYQLTDGVALRSGYQLFWVDGVALASEQITATNIFAGNGVDPTGFAFYHGALVSLDFVW